MYGWKGSSLGYFPELNKLRTCVKHILIIIFFYLIKAFYISNDAIFAQMYKTCLCVYFNMDDLIELFEQSDVSIYSVIAENVLMSNWLFCCILVFLW